jgi:hypothetical protein
MPRRQCMRRSLRRLDRTSVERPSPAHFLNDEIGFVCFAACLAPDVFQHEGTKGAQRSRRFLPSKRRRPRRPMLSHLKGSVHFEILPCQSGISMGALQLGRIDFAEVATFQDVAQENAWIEACSIPQSSTFRRERISTQLVRQAMEVKSIPRTPAWAQLPPIWNEILRMTDMAMRQFGGEAS